MSFNYSYVFITVCYMLCSEIHNLDTDNYKYFLKVNLKDLTIIALFF